MAGLPHELRTDNDDDDHDADGSLIVLTMTMLKRVLITIGMMCLQRSQQACHLAAFFTSQRIEDEGLWSSSEYWNLRNFGSSLGSRVALL